MVNKAALFGKYVGVMTFVVVVVTVVLYAVATWLHCDFPLGPAIGCGMLLLLYSIVALALYFYIRSHTPKQVTSYLLAMKVARLVLCLAFIVVYAVSGGESTLVVSLSMVVYYLATLVISSYFYIRFEYLLKESV